MYHVYCDASIEPFNPGGIVAWGFIVKAGKKTIYQEAGVSVRGGELATNNVGEYHAVIAALAWFLKLPEKDRRPILIKSDSQLIVKQCKGEWGCRDEKLVPLREMILKATKAYGKNVTFHWISRDKNEEADALSRTAYNEKELEHWRKNQLDMLFDGDDISW